MHYQIYINENENFHNHNIHVGIYGNGRRESSCKQVHSSRSCSYTLEGNLKRPKESFFYLLELKVHIDYSSKKTKLSIESPMNIFLFMDDFTENIDIISPESYKMVQKFLIFLMKIVMNILLLLLSPILSAKLVFADEISDEIFHW